MRVFYITPWSALSGLSQSTAWASLRLLDADPRVTRIVYFSPETHAVVLPSDLAGKLEHRPVISAAGGGMSGYARRFLAMRSAVLRAAVDHQPDLVICRGAPAGIFGHLLYSRFALPYAVESFEPHADYMVQSGTWSRWGIKCLIQRDWEHRVRGSATFLLTVSHAYARHLIAHDGVPGEKIRTVPCWVDSERFRPREGARQELRARLGIGDALCVVYLGKFGGIYHEPEVLASLAGLRAVARDVHVLMLTPDAPEPLCRVLRTSGFAAARISVLTVPHDQVADYLSAADVAVSFIHSGPWSFACSAIKHGEYWAVGLPVLMSPGIGDESEWLVARGAGAFIDFKRPETLAQALTSLGTERSDPGVRARIRQVARSERAPTAAVVVYDELLSYAQGRRRAAS